MSSLNVFIGLWLLVAPWARAQRVVAPVEGLGRTFSAAPAPMLSAPPMLAPAMMSPSMTLAPALSAPAAVSVAPTAVAVALTPNPAPAPLKLAAVNAAVAEFSKIDLKSAPAADIKGGADALMARAFGAEVSEAPALALGSPSAAEIPLPPFAPEAARAPALGPSVHLLSKPLHETVELGLLARVLHYALEASFQLIKAGIAWHATGSPAAGLGMLAIDLIKMPPMLSAQSLADLSLRYWWRKLSTLKRLADTPGVTRIRVLTTGDAEFSGMLARRKENTGLVFMDASDSLPEEIPGFGAPIAVADLAGRQVRLTLIHDGVAGTIDWTPTLAELLSGTPIPEDVAAAWRAKLDADNKGKSPLRRIFDFKKEKELRVEASLSDGAGGESPLGTIVFGRAVKSLVGLGRMDRIGALFGRIPAARAIPISDTTVERNGERKVEGAARRAWRRLTGALIVR